MLASDLLFLAFILGVCATGATVGWIWAHFFPPKAEDLSWRKEPTLPNKMYTVPDVDHLGRREPTLHKDL